ncbi:cysteinyl-tRNA synthetase [Apophysomyces sp. BC1034]|nr:cysteinyl-tRNA synthetase [Apophysomyces sp. BC1034]
MTHHPNHSHQHSATDSFFTRVFGHHSSQDSSRAGSPTPQLTAPTPTKTSSSITPRSTSRHNRNSSAGTIASPIRCSSPTSIPTSPSPMHRRRSFDAQGTRDTSHPSDYPSVQLSAASAYENVAFSNGRPSHAPKSQHGKPTKVPKINTVPFPRGGRHIGECSVNHVPATSQAARNASTQPGLRRSNSGDPHKYEQGQLDPGLLSAQAPKDKKRYLFSRFGKKKTGQSIDSSSQHRAHFLGRSDLNHSASSVNLTSPNTSLASTSSSNASSVSLNQRKKSNDNDNRLIQSHSLDPSGVDDPFRFIQRGPHYYTSYGHGERKKSSGSSTSRKAKDYEKSIYSDRGATLKDVREIELDQNFASLEGIVNPEYYLRNQSDILAPASLLVRDTSFDSLSAVESWAPPDSWAVQPPGMITSGAMSGSTLVEEEMPDFDEYSIIEQEKWDFCIRIFRPDATFATLQVSLNATTSEIMNKLAGKFFLQDMSKHNLVLSRHNLERVLQPHERPIQLQKMLLEQIGYTDQDRIEDVGREDNSYLLRFTFGPNKPLPLREESTLDQHVDLQGRNLPTIPIFLYNHVSHIIYLNLSKNLLIEIPVDFVQMCKSLKELLLTNNDYVTIPPSIRFIRSLESLNISSNRLRDLHPARLEELENLKILRAFNNRLESLPQSFATLQHLTVLYISNNSFTKFPEVICQIASLAYLDISFNKITEFPDEIGNLVNLVRLIAIASRISGSLPLTFTKLVKLQELDIRQNFITDLDVLCQLPNLEIIHVDYNAISIVNCEFANLKQFKMYKNHLTQFNLLPSRRRDDMEIPMGITQKPTNVLTDLNLSNCKLSSLPEDVFLNATLLETVVLDSNTLNSIPSSIGALCKLVRLSVQNNNLDSLPVEISRLSDLKELDAQKNNLKTLPKEIWLCASLKVLNCSSNLLECFPEPYSAPGVAVHLPLTPQADAIVIPSVMAHAASDGVLPAQLGSNAGQGIVPMTPNGDPTQRYLPPGSNAGNSCLDLSSPSPTNIMSPQAPPNFNPPSFFASPRNHPPPLSLSLRKLFLGDNRLTDDIWSPLSLFLELRILNLSFNDLYEIPPEGLCHQHLYELYLSGNHLTSLPADDIEKLSYLRVLAVNGNKLQTLPAEIGKLRKLLVLDVGNNVLKYNIANWPYDWNWNWNLGLKYLNLSGNKRLEIKKTHPDPANPKDKDLSDFSALTRLRMLGLMDITILGVSIPEESYDRRVRTSPSEVNSMAYGIADWLGQSDHLATWDLVMPRFQNNDDECIFGLFDGRKNIKSGCKLTKFLNDHFTYHFMVELRKNKHDDSIVSAMRRTFLSLEKELGSNTGDEKDAGASGVVCYIAGTKLYVANIGDALAIISRNNGQAFEITQKHIPLNPSEISRIRAAGGFVSNSGLLNGELNVSRSFGHFHLIPVVNANPYVSTIDLTEDDEFVIMASRGLWDRMSYQTAVDIARTEKDDLMAAAQKLRDFAITYGADDKVMVMVIGVSDLFDKRDKRLRLRGVNIGPGRGGVGADAAGMHLDDASGMLTLARLDREVPPPTEQVALVFTDIKSSTQFWETQPENMRSSIKIHDAVMRRTLRSVGGYEVKTEGDAFMVCFQNITAALLWCFTVQLQLLEADWPAGIVDTEEGREIEKDDIVIYKGLSVRMGIHWGMPVFERNPITNRMDYFGPVVNKASRICNAADGGQICVSSDVVAALRNFPGVIDNNDSTAAVMDDVSASVITGVNHSVNRDIQQLKRLGFLMMELGERRLKGLETPEMLSLVYPKQLAARMELAKSELMETQAAPAVMATPISPKPSAEPSLTPSPRIEPLDEEFREISETPTPVELEMTRPSKTARTIDPSLVCALNNLAIRLERITTGNTLSKGNAGSSTHNMYTSSCSNANTEAIVRSTTTGVSRLLDHHIKQNATDEELALLMENFVARIENAASALYLQKVGHFANVLEKLGDAIELDPMHILRALQMYSEVTGLSTSSLEMPSFY